MAPAATVLSGRSRAAPAVTSGPDAGLESGQPGVATADRWRLSTLIQELRVSSRSGTDEKAGAAACSELIDPWRVENNRRRRPILTERSRPSTTTAGWAPYGSRNMRHPAASSGPRSPRRRVHRRRPRTMITITQGTSRLAAVVAGRGPMTPAFNARGELLPLYGGVLHPRGCSGLTRVIRLVKASRTASGASAPSPAFPYDVGEPQTVGFPLYHNPAPDRLRRDHDDRRARRRHQLLRRAHAGWRATPAKQRRHQAVS